jgi:hypothetical protein
MMTTTRLLPLRTGAAVVMVAVAVAVVVAVAGEEEMMGVVVEHLTCLFTASLQERVFLSPIVFFFLLICFLLPVFLDRDSAGAPGNDGGDGALGNVRLVTTLWWSTTPT